MDAASRQLHLPARNPINVHESERILSVAAGALTLLCALDRKPLGALAGLAIGGGLLYRGLTGHCQMYQALSISTQPVEHHEAGVSASQGERVESQVIINASPKQVYEAWRNLGNLPTVLRHVTKVQEVDTKRSHWTIDTPIGIQLAWDAEIITDEPHRVIAWQSLPGGDLSTAGAVHFDAIAEGKATRLTVNMKYDPPGGKVGIWAAKALGADLSAQLREDLTKLKHRLERSSELAGEDPALSSRSSTPG